MLSDQILFCIVRNSLWLYVVFEIIKNRKKCTNNLSDALFALIYNFQELVRNIKENNFSLSLSKL